MTSCRRGSKAEHKELSRGCSRGNTVRCVHSRSLQLDILARRRCHHGDCSAFRSLELGKCHWPVQAALSGSIIKAPGFAGGYLLCLAPGRIRTDASMPHKKGKRAKRCPKHTSLPHRKTKPWSMPIYSMIYTKMQGILHYIIGIAKDPYILQRNHARTGSINQYISKWTFKRRTSVKASGKRIEFFRGCAAR